MPRSHPIVSVLLSLGLALLGSQAVAADFTGKVVGVSDGDTITVLHSPVTKQHVLDMIQELRQRQPTTIPPRRLSY